MVQARRPLRLGSKVAAATKLALDAVGRPRESVAGTMPVGPQLVNDSARTEVSGLIDGG